MVVEMVLVLSFILVLVTLLALQHTIINITISQWYYVYDNKVNTAYK